ncbi:MAG: fusion glycoprotein [Fushun ischnura senegalensis lispivirus 1]|uniref:Fusion glycoprotein n=1 Tax=Fushun ischnura senegalensis lispivirus 1 TaxID=2905564 RepID=A0A8K1XGZ8_9MONO|nr:MAG: fusion glycoprotein [Fushun ischnura senegalensis lispivirus 1]UHM27654.1 MAG: fusion glycoprotein [Fushun ischnura senegalensis lispivirus 1]
MVNLKVVLIFVCFLQTCVLARLPDEMLNLHSTPAIVSDEIGLYIEPSHLLIESHSDTYIHLVFDYSHPDLELNSTCNREHFRAMNTEIRVRSLESLLSKIFPVKKNPELGKLCSLDSKNCSINIMGAKKRGKRFLGTLLVGAASLFGIGSSISNAISIKEQYKAISYLREHASTVDASLRDVQSSFEKTAKVFDNLYLVMQNEFKHYNSYINYIECKVHDQHQSELYESMLLLIERKVTSLIDSVLFGSVSPELLNIDILTSLFDSSNLLKDSYLKNHMDLIYSLGTMYPVSLDVSKKRLHFLLRVPVIQEENILKVFHTISTGFNAQNYSHFKLFVDVDPYVAVIMDGSIMWPFPVPMNMCNERGTHLFCRSLPIRRYVSDSLLFYIMNTETRNFSLDVKKWENSIMYQPISRIFPSEHKEVTLHHLKTGVIIVGCDQITLITNIQGHLSKKINHKCDRFSNFIPYQSFSTAIAGKTVIESPNLEGHLFKIWVNISFPGGDYFPEEDVSNMIRSGLKEVKYLRQSIKQKAEMHPVFGVKYNTMEILYWIFGCSIVIISIIIMVITRRRQNKHSERLKNTQVLSLRLSEILNSLSRAKVPSARSSSEV